MATAQRQTSPDLIQQLLPARRQQDDFYHLVRWLERLDRARCAEQERRPAPVGGDGPPSREPVRFRAVNHLAFADRAVDRVEPLDEHRHDVAVSFMGLNGPTGVLPRHYTSLVQERLKQRDTALADFLDLFNHRLIALLYRAWAKYRLPVAFEDQQDTEPDAFSRALCALAGQYPGHVEQTQLYYSGHYSRHTRSAAALERLLSDLLRHPVRVDAFVGQWLPIQHRDRLVIGSARRGRNNRLGDGVLLGRRVWDVQSKLRLVIGPVSQAQHETLLPGGSRYQALQRLLDGYLPSHLEVELQFLIRDGGQRPRRLGEGPRLGGNTWLQSRPHQPLSARFQLPRRGTANTSRPADAGTDN